MEGREAVWLASLTSDPPSTAGACKLALKRHGSAVPGGEDPLIEDRHSEHPTKCSRHGLVHCVLSVSDMSALLVSVHWCSLCVCVCVCVCGVVLMHMCMLTYHVSVCACCGSMCVVCAFMHARHSCVSVQDVA